MYLDAMQAKFRIERVDVLFLDPAVRVDVDVAAARVGDLRHVHGASFLLLARAF